MKTNTANEIKIAIIGEGGVGKSALTIQIVKQRFIECYDPTICDSYTTSHDVDGCLYSVSILDTAGQEEYKGLRDSDLRTCDGFMIVYAVSNEQSLNAVRQHFDSIVRAKDGDNVPVMLVGNKCDLDDRAVTYEDGLSLADELGCLFFETSARTRINVDEAFHYLVKATARPALRGFLKKKSPAKFGGLQTRYFSISKNCLCYYRSNDDATPLGRIPLERSKGFRNVEWGAALDGRVFHIEIDGRTFELVASDTEEARQWVRGLEDLVEETERRSSRSSHASSESISTPADDAAAQWSQSCHAQHHHAAPCGSPRPAKYWKTATAATA
eukprot:Rmarinus@m.28795